MVFLNCSDSVVFLNCSYSVVFLNCSDSVVFFCFLFCYNEYEMLNRYIMFGRGICEKYQSETKNFQSRKENNENNENKLM